MWRLTSREAAMRSCAEDWSRWAPGKPLAAKDAEGTGSIDPSDALDGQPHRVVHEAQEVVLERWSRVPERRRRDPFAPEGDAAKWRLLAMRAAQRVHELRRRGGSRRWSTSIQTPDQRRELETGWRYGLNPWAKFWELFFTANGRSITHRSSRHQGPALKAWPGGGLLLTRFEVGLQAEARLDSRLWA